MTGVDEPQEELCIEDVIEVQAKRADLLLETRASRTQTAGGRSRARAPTSACP